MVSGILLFIGMPQFESAFSLFSCLNWATIFCPTSQSLSTINSNVTLAPLPVL